MATVKDADQVSIIIPTYREADFIGPLVKHCLKQDNVLEVIVVDANSSDKTPEIAQSYGAKVQEAEVAGRASQMNQGAAEAKGAILHFIHADAMPPENFARQVCSIVDQEFKAGCFRSAFNTNNRFLLANSYFTRFNGIVFRGGGQTLFCAAAIFWRVGAYNPDLRVMEEYDLILRLQKHTNFYIIPQNVIVSARKYQQQGAIKLQLAYAVIFLLFFIGIPQERLMYLYKRLIP